MSTTPQDDYNELEELLRATAPDPQGSEDDAKPNTPLEFDPEQYVFGDGEDENVEVETPATPAATVTPGVTGTIDPTILELQRGQMATNKSIADALERLSSNRQAETAPAPDTFFDVQDVTDEEAGVYKAAMPFVQKVVNNSARRILADYDERYVKPVWQENQELKQRLAQIDSNVQTSAQSALMGQLRSAVPEYDNILQSQEWQNKLNEPVASGASMTYRTIAAEMARVGDVAGVAALMNSARKQVPDPQKNVSPGRTPAAAPASRANVPQKKLPYSKLDQAQREYLSGQMTADKFQKIESLYTNADLMGNVDYNR
jgi:hypothetical protein